MHHGFVLRDGAFHKRSMRPTRRSRIALVRAQRLSIVNLGGTTFSNGQNTTGQKFMSLANAVINTSGNGIDHLPGDVAGAVESGGVHL